MKQGKLELTGVKGEGEALKSMHWYIEYICDKMKEFLLTKNSSYGNSAAEPIQIFCKQDSVEQINARIDDKLSRLARGSAYGSEDTEKDLTGYLLLRMAVMERNRDMLK